MVKIVYSLVLPPIIWLLYGWPSLQYAGNLALLIVVVAHLYAVIWQDQLFAIFQGEPFTYSMVARAINIIPVVGAVITSGVLLAMFGRQIEAVGAIPNLVWGLFAVSALFTITFPVFTSRHMSPLPRASERREYENPSDS